MKRTIVMLTCAALATLACDVDDDTRPDLAELEAIEDDEDAGAVQAIDGLAAEARDPEAGYYDCPGSANFCFWYQPYYGGIPVGLSGGDFAIPNFGAAIYSMKKRAGTRRVKVFGGVNYTGACKVINPDGGANESAYLPFPVWSAKRIEASAPGTC